MNKFWLCAVMLVWPLAATATEPTLLPARVTSAIEARIAAGEYPAVVVVVVDGKRSHVYGFGKLADGEAPDARSVFEIGSVTKTFTATLLAQAVNRGDVTLDTPVAKLLPGFTLPVRNGKPITLDELATQFSGLPRLPSNLQPADPRNPYAGYDTAQLKAFLASYTLPRDPGAKYEYSNLGFGLLGYALAQRADTTYADLVRKRIFKPLGMTSSGVKLDAAERARLAQGHDANGNPIGTWDFGVLAGRGAIKSDGADMLRYLRANMARTGGHVVAAMRLAQKPRRTMAPDERIGLAWMTRHAKAGDVIWHNGMTGGYASFMGFSADGKRGVVILTNAQRSVDDLGFAVLLPDSPLAAAHKQISMSVTQLDAYTGQYRRGPHFIITVMRNGDQLYAQATGQSAFPVYPEAHDAFFAKVTDIQLTFQRGKDGKVASLILRQGGHTSQPAPRLSAAEAQKAAAPNAIHLDSATLQQYVGRYRLAPGAIFDITLKDGELLARLTGQPAIPVYARAKDEFFYTVVDAQLSFTRGTDGKVDAVVLHQNGIDRKAARIP